MLAGAEENVKENELFYFHSLTLLHPILIDAFAELPASLQEVPALSSRTFDRASSPP